jgi:hypothetical protein
MDELTVTYTTQPFVASPNALAQSTVLDATGQYYESTLLIHSTRACGGQNHSKFGLINQQPHGQQRRVLYFC